MKSLSTIGKFVFFVSFFTLLTAGSAGAQCILSVSDALTASDSVQLGRLSRNVIPQDWSGTEQVPATINATTLYRYRVYKVTVHNTPFVQISVDSVSTRTFFSAYDTSYDPAAGLQMNWLGDAGVSGNDFQTNPVFFQVRIPQNHELLVVVNNTAAADGGVGDPFHLIVEGFADPEFTERVRGQAACNDLP